MDKRRPAVGGRRTVGRRTSDVGREGLLFRRPISRSSDDRPGPRIAIDGQSLTLEDLEAVARFGRSVELAPAAVDRIGRARRSVERLLAGKNPVYAVNTGVGHLKNRRIRKSELDALQINIIRSHAAGVGEPLPEATVRAAMLLLANGLARGHSGAGLESVRLLLDCLNHRLTPVVPCQGSVGSSGDLAPLAHMALVLIGEGEAVYEGERRAGGEALDHAGLRPLQLQAKEGVSLINGTQVMTAMAGLTCLQALRLVQMADMAAAMSVEGLLGSNNAFREEIVRLRPHPGQLASAANLRTLTAASDLIASHADCEAVQDAYSLRCAPQVHGASRDALSYCRSVLDIEINSVTDNPLVFPDRDQVWSGGNFHGQPLAIACDTMGIALSELGSIAERRIERLVNPALSRGLPAFLSPQPGLHSGYMLAQYTAAALASENKGLAHPASVDSIPTSGNQEDHNSMGTIAARRAEQILKTVQTILAIEFLCASQALDFRAPLTPGAGVAAIHRWIRARIPFLSEDRPLAPEIAAMRDFVASGEMLQAVQGGVELV